MSDISDFQMGELGSVLREQMASQMKKKQIKQVAIFYISQECEISIGDLESDMNDWLESIQTDNCKIIDIKLGTHDDQMMVMVVYTRDIEV